VTSARRMRPEDDLLALPEEDVYRLIDVAYRHLFMEQSMAEIGRDFGVSRERVRQWLEKLPPTMRGPAGREKIYWNAARRQMLVTIIERLNEEIVCAVCGGWVIRRRRGPRSTSEAEFPTCSRECAETIEVARWRVSNDLHERHRRYVARSILNHPEGKSVSKIGWAKAMLSDDPPPPNRRFALPDSNATRVAKRIEAAS
jgi:hypothetical protein